VRREKLRAQVAQILESAPIDFGGGCSVSKATVFAHIITSQRITRSIDIGVYRGRSFLPQALAHRDTGGKVYGIDPYSKFDAREYDNKELGKKIDAFVTATDWDALYDEVNGLRSSLGLEAQSELVRTTSDKAAKELKGTFGLIHVDGNHDTAAVLADVAAYHALLEPGNGFLVLDDISWSSVKPAVDWVSKQMTLLYARVDTFNDYAVFWNGTSAAKKSRLRASIALAGES
jgi:predicted O-methyltransferase YrrM